MTCSNIKRKWHPKLFSVFSPRNDRVRFSPTALERYIHPVFKSTAHTRPENIGAVADIIFRCVHVVEWDSSRGRYSSCRGLYNFIATQFAKPLRLHNNSGNIHLLQPGSASDILHLRQIDFFTRFRNLPNLPGKNVTSQHHRLETAHGQPKRDN